MIDVTALANANTEAELDEAIKKVNEKAGKKTKTAAGNKPKRLEILDELRGLCVLAMVLYHVFFLYGQAYGWSGGMRAYEWLTPFTPVISAMFILISGICSRLSADPKKRALTILVFALLTTLISMTLVPSLGIKNATVWFGLLHLVGCSKLLFLLGKKLFENKIVSLLGIPLSLLLFIYTSSIGDGVFSLRGAMEINLPAKLYESDIFLWLGIHTPGFASWDYFPLLPYFFLFLFGAFLGQYATKEMPEFCYKRFLVPLGWLGKHSLVVYLLHMPVLFGLSYLVKTLSGG